MNNPNYKNDKAVREQVERILKLRKLYHAASEEKAVLGKQGTTEFKKLERLIAGKEK